MILTVDVGLKNLAMCAMKSATEHVETYEIVLWDVYNTLEDDEKHCKCSKKNGQMCGKKAGFQHRGDCGETVYTCKTHFPKDRCIAKNNKYKAKVVTDYLLQDIAAIILQTMNTFFKTHCDLLTHVDKVLIELQPKVNNKMKLISHILYGKFVELYCDTKTVVRFVRASQKLKAYKGPPVLCTLKGAYARRKFLSVEYTRWFLNTCFNSLQRDTWLSVFDSHKKKDDLGDVFLMAINALATPRRQITGPQRTTSRSKIHSKLQRRMCD